MADNYTFSQLILDVKRTSGLYSKVPEIIRTARAVLKSCHTVGFFKADLVEAQIICTGVVDNLYKQPVKPFTHRKIYNICNSLRSTNNVRDEYVPVSPAELNKNKRPKRYHYISGGYLCIAPVNENDVLYFGEILYPTIFSFYELEADRPATYDVITDTWNYNSAYVSSEERATARTLVTNWMIQNHYEILIDGILATVWKEVDDPRSGAAYSRYISGRKDILNQNEVLTMPVYGGKYGQI